MTDNTHLLNTVMDYKMELFPTLEESFANAPRPGYIRPSTIFRAILSQPEILYYFTSFLDVDEFVILYSLSKRFHELINEALTTCIERNARRHAPESLAVFPFRCYRSLCIFDPHLRHNNSVEQRTGQPQARDVPSFRWLRMIMFREETVESIMLQMAEAGHLLPCDASLTLKKIWFLMDIPDTARRVGTVHNDEIWSNEDLLLATMFFIKLDMRCTDPMDGGAKPVIRKLLMAQPTLSAVDMVLQRRQMRDMYDVVQLFVEWRKLVPDFTGEDSVFGMPALSAGSLQFEGRVADPRRYKLLRPDEIVLKESVRRNMRLNQWYMDLMLWGNIDEDTGENIWPPSVRKMMAERETQLEHEEHEVQKGKQRVETS